LEKIGEGFAYRAFWLTLDNGRSAVARLPYFDEEAWRYVELSTASQVATMDLAPNIMGLPVPKVYTWSSDPESKVGAPYIVTEEPEGTNLEASWHSMRLDEKENILDQVVDFQSKLLDFSFSRQVTYFGRPSTATDDFLSYGSIFYASEDIEGCKPARIVSGWLPLNLRRELQDRFVIGPCMRKDFWKDRRGLLEC
jgi:hypothetical protein